MPQQTITKRFDQGYVDSRPEGDLRPGELTVATGVVYRPGDPARVWKMDGRSQFGNTTISAAVDGIAICQFDSGGTDEFLAFINNTLYYDSISDVDTNGTFLNNTAITGSSMDTAHYNNRWYLAFGSDNRVLEPDETLRSMGMIAPVEELELFAHGTSGTVERPTTETTQSGTWTHSSDGGTDDGWDGDLDTSLYTSLSSAGSSQTIVDGFSNNAVTDRILQITWSLHASGGGALANKLFPDDGGADSLAGWNVTVKFELDEGSGFSTILESVYRRQQPVQSFTYEIADGTTLANVDVKITLTYNKGLKQCTFKLHDMKIYDESDASTFSLDTGLYYAVTEYDEDEGIESPPGPVAFLAAADFQNKNSVDIILPAAAQNSNATHYRLYRGFDGGTSSQLAFLQPIPVNTPRGRTIDDFTVAAHDILPNSWPIGILTVIQGGGEVISFRDEPPPALRRITTFQGSLVGLSDTDTRALFYSIAGSPESWPDLNVIDSFNLPEHDELVDILEINGSLIVAGREVMIRLDELPRTVGGNFIASDIVQIKGAPGCVGDYAMAAVEYQGVAHAAWISDEQGVLITDGSRYRSISDDIDWHQFQNLDKTSWVLEWIPVINCLMFGYVDATAPTQRYFLLSLDRSHLKEDGQAKVSGPHYGSVNDIAHGRISNIFRVFSAHRSDGKVYEEFDWTTGADASQSFSSTQLPLTITTGKEYGPGWSGYEALDGRLRFGNFGTGETGTIDYTTARDSSGVSATKQIASVDLATSAGIKGTQFRVGRSGEHHQFSLSHTADAGSNTLRFQRGNVVDLALRVIPKGGEGGKDAIA